jgi:hypothetical protein
VKAFSCRHAKVKARVTAESYDHFSQSRAITRAAKRRATFRKQARQTMATRHLCLDERWAKYGKTRAQHAEVVQQSAFRHENRKARSPTDWLAKASLFALSGLGVPR